MKKTRRPISDDDMLDEYDFRGGVRGKYAKRYAEGVNIVVLEPDVMAAFPDSEAVNKALRGLLKSSGRTPRKTA